VAALLFAAVVAWWPVDAAAQDADQWRILLLFSNESMMPASEAIASGFRETIDANIRERRLLFAEYLDADRFPDPEHEARMAAFLGEKYRTTRIDLAVALGPQALAFLASNRPVLFPDAPIVFVGINENSRSQWASLPNATGVVSQFDPVKTVELAMQLQPRARRVVVVTGASTFDRQWEAVARDKLVPFQDRLEVTYLAGRPLAETLSQVGRLPRDTIVLFLTFLEDGAGEKFISREVAERVAAAASAPVSSVYDTYGCRGRAHRVAHPCRRGAGERPAEFGWRHILHRRLAATAALGAERGRPAAGYGGPLQGDVVLGSLQEASSRRNRRGVGAIRAHRRPVAPGAPAPARRNVPAEQRRALSRRGGNAGGTDLPLPAGRHADLRQ
jgi:hypothetical protein